VDYLQGRAEAPSKNQVEHADDLKNHGRNTIRAAIDLGVSKGWLAIRKGPNRADEIHLNPASSPVRQGSPSVRQRTSDEFASAPI
jgi:hypothetical protein